MGVCLDERVKDIFSSGTSALFTSPRFGSPAGVLNFQGHVPSMGQKLRDLVSSVRSGGLEELNFPCPLQSLSSPAWLLPTLEDTRSTLVRKHCTRAPCPMVLFVPPFFTPCSARICIAPLERPQKCLLSTATRRDYRSFSRENTDIFTPFSHG